MLLHLKDGEVPIVRSDAANAYQLMLDVAAAIREEPKRYDQEDWISVQGERTEKTRIYPVCGTIACRAGWMCVLTETFERDSRGNINNDTIRYVADRILKLDEWEDLLHNSEDRQFRHEVKELFGGNALIDENDDDPKVYDEEGCRLSVDPGDPVYAELGARGVEKFAEKWKERLLAIPIKSQWSIDPNATTETPL